MTLNRFAIEGGNYRRFGKLVKKWARAEVPMPDGDLELFKQQLQDEGIVAQWPTGDNEVTGIKVQQLDRNTLSFNVPPLPFIEESEEYFKHNPYPLPNYYTYLFNAAPDARRLDEDDPQNALHEYRIGDYTVANCA
jgi:hypothetical protein